MVTDEEIRQAHANLASKYGPMQTMLATVESVDAAAFTCSLIDDDDLPYVGVRLRPVLDGNEGLTVFPKQGTWALAIRIEEAEDWMIIAVGEADKYRIKIGALVFEVDSDSGKFTLANGADNLKDVITLVIEAVMQIVIMMGNPPDYVKLQQAMTKLNNLM